jgi:hypothetical protein
MKEYFYQTDSMGLRERRCLGVIMFARLWRVLRYGETNLNAKEELLFQEN